MEIGKRLRLSREVTEDVTAASFREGLMPVLATPYLVAFLEDAAERCVADDLDETQITLGTAVDIRHLSAAPVGMTVTCEAVLTGIDRRRLTFDVRAWDDAGPICEGTHERFVADRERFLREASAKLDGPKKAE